MLKVKENNKIDNYLFTGYSKKKLYCLSKTYEELARLYRGMTQEEGFAGSRNDILRQYQLYQANQVFANHLEEISEAFADVADTVMHVNVPAAHKRRALVQFLKKRGIVVRGIIFLEGGGSADRISIEARLGGRRMMNAAELGGLLSDFFGRRLIPSYESAQCLVRGYETFIFEDEPRYALMSAVSRAVKEGEKISGDNFSLEEYNQNQTTLMISDGMGSGEQAHKDSQAVIELMEKLLEAGFNKEKAFTMANSALASQAQCGSLTTLDLCSVNLLTGEAEFLKAGAAPSYIKRGARAEEIASDTLPLGSIAELCPMLQSARLEHGDMLVMVSDGIADAFGDTPSESLAQAIAGSSTLNPKGLSDYLLRYAINRQGGHITDDMTVLVCSVIKSAYR